MPTGDDCGSTECTDVDRGDWFFRVILILPSTANSALVHVDLLTPCSRQSQRPAAQASGMSPSAVDKPRADAILLLRLVVV